MRKIILSADDFGRSHERNLAIDYAFKNGLIKSAALLVNSDFSDEAAKMARGGGYINLVHCHLNLVSGAMSGNAHPLNSEFLTCSAFCENGEFKQKGAYDYAGINSLKYAQLIFLELESQYKKFIELTGNKGNNSHIDFHLYYNLNFLVACAIRKLVKKYNIKTVRYYGEHHHKLFGKKMRLRLFFIKVLSVLKTSPAKSCNIDFYLSDKESFCKDKYIELYVHPDYVDGELIDNSVSSFGHRMKQLSENFDLIKNDGQIISWNDLNH